MCGIRVSWNSSRVSCSGQEHESLRTVKLGDLQVIPLRRSNSDVSSVAATVKPNKSRYSYIGPDQHTKNLFLSHAELGYFV